MLVGEHTLNGVLVCSASMDYFADCVSVKERLGVYPLFQADNILSLFLYNNIKVIKSRNR